MSARRPPSLARLSPGDRPSSQPGTLHARSLAGGIRVAPAPGRTIRFGRGGKPDTHLQVGRDDTHVSRRHGELTYRGRNWWLRNTGQQLLRLPRGQLMHAATEPIPLSAGYTPVFVRGSGYREHLVELYVTDYDDDGPGAKETALTVAPKRWPLSDDERLALIVIGQEYLRYDPEPRPLVYRRAVAQLRALQPEYGWTKRKVEDRVAAVRRRLHEAGTVRAKLVRDEDDDACDSTLMHNLLRELVESTTLVPPDLEVLDRGLEAD
ncbi:FHA domain-containing protein [Streptomyces sp. 7-21]|uniref:FHA domain-containing protein n=1 Tax=Streptomyces sp. 7-21 TaxID=2802283 RepID=UPI00191D54EA|nr:FHA domain-containing protein [Streptomyces sp. 7-21]MBL1065270.1 FHA domain-containing protein [Streptomyces sp. 7-21]